MTFCYITGAGTDSSEKEGCDGLRFGKRGNGKCIDGDF